MKITISPEQQLHELKNKMYSPLCGLLTSYGYNIHERFGPRVYVSGGELTGAHLLVGQQAPKPGSYHIGGTGILGYEAAIKTYGETAERYAGVISALQISDKGRFESYDSLVMENEPVLSSGKMDLFDLESLPHPFPFLKFDPASPITWIQADNIGFGEDRKWIPAQQFMIGYSPRTDEGERRFSAAVSTGTAVHTSRIKALQSALYELIQIDSAMGHWYGRTSAVRIGFDSRVKDLQHVLDKHMRKGGSRAEFYLLPSPDLPGFSVACLILEPFGRVPVVSVGLGAADSLEKSMYKAWLEGVGVKTLASWSLVNRLSEEGVGDVDTSAMYDLDSSVIHAAFPEGASKVFERFGSSAMTNASDLPADVERDDDEDVRHIIGAFKRSGKELYCSDLTTRDIASSGFKAIRVWSPDTLSLCLPSAPPNKHKRFNDYGGFAHVDPHPYP